MTSGMKKYKTMKRKAKHRDSLWYRGCDQVTQGPKPKRAKPKDIEVETGIPAYYRTAAWRKLRAQVKMRDGGTCQYCGKNAQTADHIVPRSHGGADDETNLVACCNACNKLVGAREFTSFDDKKAWILAQIAPRPITRKREALTPA